MRSPIHSRGRSSSSPKVRRSSWEPSNEVARDQRHPSQPLPPAMTYHRPVDSVAGRMGSGRPSLERLSWPLAGGCEIDEALTLIPIFEALLEEGTTRAARGRMTLAQRGDPSAC